MTMSLAIPVGLLT